MKPVVVENISKSFNGTPAVLKVNFDVNQGEIFGLIGPDGAGKTTLFRILTTLLYPDEGQALVLGKHSTRDYKEIRKRIGYMPGKFSLYPDLSVKENLSFFATIFGTTVNQNYHLIKDIYEQLAPFAKRRAGNLSGGMKQKLALCCALIHQPEILFLDEPTTGVDAVSRAEFWEMLDRLQKKGVTILASTPYMDEASLCDRVALIQKGHILRIDTPQRITHDFPKPLYAIRAKNLFKLLQDLRLMESTERAEPFGEYLHLTTRDPVSRDQVIDFLKTKGHEEIELAPVEATIEDVFLELT